MAIIMFRGFGEGPMPNNDMGLMEPAGTGYGTWNESGVHVAGGRTGPYYFRMEKGGYLEWFPETALSSMTLGFAYNFIESDTSGQFMAMCATAVAGGRAAADLGPYLDAVGNGVINVHAGDGTLLGSTPQGTYSMGTWHYYEMQAVLDGSGGTGSFKLRVDGIERVSVPAGTVLMGDNTKNTIVRWHIKANSYSSYGNGNYEGIDDVYVTDDATFLGAVKIPMLRPTGVGGHNAGVGSDGDSVDNHLLVDEDPMNDSADYVEVQAAGDKQTFTLDDLDPAVTSVLAVKHMGYLGAPSGQSGSVKTFYRIPDDQATPAYTDHDDRTHAISSSYKGRPGLIHTTNPKTGSAWTPEKVNGLELGYELP